MKNKTLKNILSALAVAFFGYILLNFTFIIDFLFQTLIDKEVKIFLSIEGNKIWLWYPAVKHLFFLFLIVLLSRYIFKSKLKTIYKNIYFTVPLSAIYVTAGMFLYRWPIAAFLTSSYFFFGFLYFFKRTKLSWLYYYTLILVTLVFLIGSLLGTQI